MWVFAVKPQAWAWAGILGSLVMIGLVVFPLIPAALGQVDPRVEQAVLDEDWTEVGGLLESVDDGSLPAVARFVKGHACLALNRNNESLCLFLSNLEGDTLEVRENIGQWRAWTQALVRSNPTRPVGHYLYGDALARSDQWDIALEQLEQALELQPHHTLSLNARGVILAKLGRTGPARVELERATEAGRLALADAYANIGALRIQTRDGAEGALRAFDEALSLSPDFGMALQGRGCINMVLNRFKPAGEDFARAESLAICEDMRALFAKDALEIQTYWAGLESSEVLAFQAWPDSLGGPGTTFDRRVFGNAATAWDAYQAFPTQRNFNRFSGSFSTLSPIEKQEFMDTHMSRSFEQSPDLQKEFATHKSVLFDWNQHGARGVADMASLAGTTAGGIAGGAATKTWPGAGAGAALGKGIGDWFKNTFNRWSDIHIDNVNTWDTKFGNPTSGVGGVEASFARAVWEQGDWPIRAYYGLLYR